MWKSRAFRPLPLMRTSSQRKRLLDEIRREIQLQLADEDLDVRVLGEPRQIELLDVLEVDQDNLLLHC